MDVWLIISLCSSTSTSLCFRKTHWIEGPQIDVPINTTFELISRKMLSQSVQRLTFNVTGPDHMGLMVSPVKEAELLRWSILEGAPLAGPKWNGRETYFVYFSYADKPKSWVFSLDLRVSTISILNYKPISTYQSIFKVYAVELFVLLGISNTI